MQRSPAEKREKQDRRLTAADWLLFIGLVSALASAPLVMGGVRESQEAWRSQDPAWRRYGIVQADIRELRAVTSAFNGGRSPAVLDELADERQFYADSTIGLYLEEAIERSRRSSESEIDAVYAVAALEAAQIELGKAEVQAWQTVPVDLKSRLEQARNLLNLGAAGFLSALLLIATGGSIKMIDREKRRAHR